MEVSESLPAESAEELQIPATASHQAMGLDSTASEDGTEKSVRSTSSEKQMLPVCSLVVFMIFLGMVVNYILRFNINITVVAMVNRSASETEGSANGSKGQCQYHHAPDAAEPRQPRQNSQFEWDEQVTGHVLGAFFYGYFTTQLVGGRMAELANAKHVFGVPLLLAALLTLLTPSAAYGGWELLVALRATMGVIMGVTYPASFVILTAWVPVSQMNWLVLLAQSGCDLGTVIAMPMSKAIISRLGWEYVFYVQGLLAIVWFLVWSTVVTATPEHHWFITAKEQRLISAGASRRHAEPQPALPWRQMLGSRPLWCYYMGYFGICWIYYSLLSDLPQYYDIIFGEDIWANALLNSLPYLGLWLFILLNGWFSDFAVEKGMMQPLNLRRMAQVVSCLIPATLLVIVSFLGCHSRAIEGILVVTIILQGAGYSLCVVPMELSPNFAGTIAGVSNMLGSTPGFLGPLVVTALTRSHDTVARWRACFLITAGIGTVCSAAFLAGGSTRRQPWNGPQPQPRQSQVAAASSAVSHTPQPGDHVPEESESARSVQSQSQQLI